MKSMRLYTGMKIFFPDPYVLRIEYPDEYPGFNSESYRKVIWSAYRLIKGTWGYSALIPEEVMVKNDYNHPAPPGPGHFAGMSPNLIVSSLLDSDYRLVDRAYLCFADELDALQFRLSISSTACRVFMWPERQFTIREYIEVDES